MHRPSRRGALAVAVVAAVGTGSAAVSTASAAEPRQLGLGGLLGGLPLPDVGPALQPVLDQVTTLAPEQVTALLDTLAPADLGTLLTGANLEQLTAIVTSLTPAELDAALATLTPQQQQQVAAKMAQAQAARPRPTAPTAAPAAPRPFTAYRARVSSAKMSKSRGSARIRVTCPANSPKGCYVRITGKVAGRRAMTPKFFLLAPNSTQSATVRLTRTAAKRLRTKGGSLRLTALTALSSLPQTSKTTRVKAPRKKS